MADLDAFLTSVESKLRGPFSSLDLSKAVSTRALRGSLSADEYLDRISQVLSRSDKIIQMRVMVGLLGLDPEQDTDREIDKILTQAQEARTAQETPLHEEWVRIIAGLVQGIMFQNEDDTRSRGQEANERLEKTCTEIIRRVQELEQDTEEMEDDPSRLTTADVDPTFAPYRYALLNPALLKATLPETQSHEHFQVQEEPDILLMDQNEDQARVQEEQEHATSGRQVKRPPTAGGTAATTGTGQAAKNASGATTATDIPGFGRPKAKAAVSNRPKTSMFMPRKLGAATSAARAVGPVKPVVKTALHTRKAGAAQMLLNKGKRNRLNAMAGSSAAASAAVPGVRGRANKLGNNKSRMQMIDVAEVQDLAKEQIGRVDPKDTGKKVAGQKRKSEATTEKSARSKKEETNGTAAAAATKAPEAPPKANAKPKAAVVAAASTTEDSAGALASAALSKYQAQLAGAQQTTTNNNGNSNSNNNAGNSNSNSNSNAAGAPAPGTSIAQASTTPKQQDWRHLLKEKSNKLSAEDRFRVQQFFVDRFNPTPAAPTYKMKLHEERTTDAKTNEPVKETYYLELDYRTFTSKQSKKVKRY